MSCRACACCVLFSELHIMSCPCRVVLCKVVHVRLCCACCLEFCNIMLCCVLFCCVELCYAVPCCAMLPCVAGYAVFCNVLLCCILDCCVALGMGLR